MNDKLLELYYKLNKFHKSFLENKFRFITFNKVYNSNFFYLYLMQQNNILKDNPYEKIVFNYLSKSESNYPGSSCLLVDKLLKRLNNNYENNELLKTDCNVDNLKLYLESITSKEYSSLFYNILDFSGPDASLICNPTENIEMSVIKKNDTCFNLNIHESFRGVYFSNQTATTKTFIVSVMDAYIEKESEIMSLINYSFDQKIPVVLICRGISDLAVSALKSIIIKNNIFIYPYIAKFDNEDPFVLQDISECLDTELFSLDKGDSLYTKIVEKTSCRKLKLKSNSIQVFDVNKNLINKINNLIKDTNDLDIKKYLFKRKNRLTPNIIEINIPKDKIEFISEIKNLIRCYNSCIIYGFIEKDKKILSYREQYITNILSEKLFSTLNNIGYTIKEKLNV